MAKGNETRGRILEIAEAAVLAKGFGATSIEEIIAEAGITKSGFFYHFRDKNELAREMVRRFMEENDALFDAIFGRGRELSDDPLQAFLIGLKLLAETLREVKSRHPGCLVASICYQERLFDREVTEMIRQVAIDWNARFRTQLEEIAEHYPLRHGLTTTDLSDALSCLIDGGILMAKLHGDAAHLERQILTYRQFVQMAFAPEMAARHPAAWAVAAE